MEEKDKQEIVKYLKKNGWNEEEIELLNKIEETLPNHEDIFNYVWGKVYCGDTKEKTIEIVQSFLDGLDRLVKLVGAKNVLSYSCLSDTAISETIRESALPDLCSVIMWMAEEQRLCIAVNPQHIGDHWSVFYSKEEAKKVECVPMDWGDRNG